MAHHKSAIKRARQSLKRRARNQGQRSRVKTAVKNLRSAITEGDASSAGTALTKAESVLRRAASKGAIPTKRASRQISRLARHVHQLGQA